MAWLPKNGGVRVRVAELALGGAAEDAPATALLSARPELRHLPYSLDANGITVEQVGRGGGAGQRSEATRLWLCCAALFARLRRGFGAAAPRCSA